MVTHPYFSSVRKPQKVLTHSLEFHLIHPAMQWRLEILTPAKNRQCGEHLKGSIEALLTILGQHLQYVDA